MTLLRITGDLAVNPDLIISLEWVRSAYSDSFLVIVMTNGGEHRIPHRPGTLDGCDAYKIQAAILAATVAPTT